MCCEAAWRGAGSHGRCGGGGAGCRGHPDNSIPPVSSSASVLLTRRQAQRLPPPPSSAQRRAEAAGPPHRRVSLGRHTVRAKLGYLAMSRGPSSRPGGPGTIPLHQTEHHRMSAFPPAGPGGGWRWQPGRRGRASERCTGGPCPTPRPAAGEGRLASPWPPRPRLCPGQKRREAGEAPAWHPHSRQGWLQRGGSRGGNPLACWGLGDRGRGWAGY